MAGTAKSPIMVPTQSPEIRIWRGCLDWAPAPTNMKMLAKIADFIQLIMCQNSHFWTKPTSDNNCLLLLNLVSLHALLDSTWRVQRGFQTFPHCWHTKVVRKQSPKLPESRTSPASLTYLLTEEESSRLASLRCLLPIRKKRLKVEL